MRRRRPLPAGRELLQVAEAPGAVPGLQHVSALADGSLSWLCAGMNHCAIAAAHRDAPTWSDAWRLECEARYLLRIGGMRARRAALDRPARALRRLSLETEMKRLWGLGCR